MASSHSQEPAKCRLESRLAAPVKLALSERTSKAPIRQVRLAAIALLSLPIISFVVEPQHLNCQSTSPELLFQQAVAAQDRGDDESAVRDYEALLRLRPDAVAVRVNLGVTFAHLKRFKDAIQQYCIVLAANPNDHVARVNMAEAYFEGGDTAEATIELEKLHRESADDEEAALLLAEVYSKSDRYADALPMLLRLEANHPDDPDVAGALGKALVHDGKVEQGATRLEKAAAASGTAENFVLAGQARFSISQFDLASRDAAAAELLNPHQAGLLTLKGIILEQTSNYDEAEPILLRAISDDPEDFNANLYLGGLFYFKRDLTKARIYLSRAVQLEPKSPQARYEFALMERAEGDLTGSLKDLRLVTQESPGWLQPHIELAALLYRLRNPVEGAKERAIVDRMMAVPLQSQPATPN
jgi:Flp pilus assembly protein TadD